MSTVGFAPVNNIQTKGIMPQQKPTRQIVREEIQRQKELDKLEEKYNNGEISKFEYNVAKAMIKMGDVLEEIKPRPNYATTA